MAEAGDEIVITKTGVVQEGDGIKVEETREARELDETEGGWYEGAYGIPTYVFPVVKGREFTAPVASPQLDAHDALVYHFKNPDPIHFSENESMGVAVPTCFEVKWSDQTLPKDTFPLYRYAIHTSHEPNGVKKEPWGLSLHNNSISIVCCANTLDALALKKTTEELRSEDHSPEQRIPLPHGATQAVVWVIPFDADQRQAEAQRCIDICAKASIGYFYRPFQTVAFAVPKNLSGPPTLDVEFRIQECPASCDINHMHMRAADF